MCDFNFEANFNKILILQKKISENIFSVGSKTTETYLL
jgi:hypothetical protein